jgi:hypothetical protein
VVLYDGHQYRSLRWSEVLKHTTKSPDMMSEYDVVLDHDTVGRLFPRERAAASNGGGVVGG